MILKREDLPSIPKENNFDFLRFTLATIVACCHYCRLTGREPILPSGSSPISVSAFFVISGFLIFMSFCNTKNFQAYVEKRVKRIFPAYCCIVLASFLIFSLVSQLDFKEYFTSKESYQYLLANLTFLNFLHPALPGVLADAPFTDAVNPSLWTIKIELALYSSVPLIAFAAIKKRILLPITSVLLSILCYYLNWKADMTQIALYDTIGAMIYKSNMFLIGAWFYLYFDLLYKYRYYILLASLLCFPLKECGWGDMLFPFSLAGCIFGLAFSMSFLNKFGKIGDLSYGTFLYHAPIIQFFTAMGWNNENRLSIIMVITYILAFCSWHLMEKKILKRG